MIKGLSTEVGNGPSGGSAVPPLHEPSSQRNHCQGNGTHSIDQHSPDNCLVHGPDARPLLEFNAPHEPGHFLSPSLLHSEWRREFPGHCARLGPCNRESLRPPLPRFPTQEAGAGWGEEAFAHGMPLSPTLSPLVPHGREKKSAFEPLVTGQGKTIGTGSRGSGGSRGPAATGSLVSKAGRRPTAADLKRHPRYVELRPLPPSSPGERVGVRGKGAYECPSGHGPFHGAVRNKSSRCSVQTLCPHSP